MKRIDRMVGIDGTAHGRMNTSESHLIHGRAVTKKPDRNSAIAIFRLMATMRKIERVDDRRREDRIVGEA